MAVDRRFDESELTEQIIGVMFRVYTSLGFGYQERYYQRAFEVELQKLELSFVREQMMPLRYEGKIIGRYFADFVIEARVVVELKVASEVLESHVGQVLGYLKASGHKVGLLFVITKQRTLVKRVVNGVSA